MTENKDKISISIDPDLLRRVDAVCAAREETRSSMIERVLKNEIAGEEQFLKDMENPINRAIMSTIINTPGLLAAVARLVNEHLEAGDLDHMREKLPQQMERGKRRAAERSKGAARGEGPATAGA